jgi:hypothetical protein
MESFSVCAASLRIGCIGEVARVSIQNVLLYMVKNPSLMHLDFSLHLFPRSSNSDFSSFGGGIRLVTIRRANDFSSYSLRRINELKRPTPAQSHPGREEYSSYIKS